MGLLDYKFADTKQAQDLMALGNKMGVMQGMGQAQSPMQRALSMPSSIGAQSANLFNIPKYLPKQMTWEQMTGQNQTIAPYIDWAKISGGGSASTYQPMYDSYKSGGGTLPAYDWYNIYQKPTVANNSYGGYADGGGY